MKKLLLSAATLALFAGAAVAADLPSRKGPPVLPPPPPPPPMWTGFYAGLNAGYGFGTNDNTQSIAIGNMPFTGGYHGPKNDFGRHDKGYWDNYSGMTTLGAGLALSGVAPMTQDGFIGGGQIGYNYQWGPSFVIGIEADMQGTGIRGNSRAVGLGADSALVGQSFRRDNLHHQYDLNSTAWGGTSVNAGVDWMGTVRGRLGYLVTPTMLVFGTGGLTYGGVYANVNNYAVSSSSVTDYHYKRDNVDATSLGGYNHTFIGGGSKSSTLVGWNAGGGIEWMFMPNWSLKAEGIYWNMGNMTLPTAAIATAPFGGQNGWDANNFASSPATAIGATRVNYQGVIARAGVNYHFNWAAAAPIVAKY